jgi:CDGSH-type Zn-finger protein
MTGPLKGFTLTSLFIVVNFDRFKANLANLRLKLSTELDRAVQDDEAFQQDEFLALCRPGNSYSTSQKPRWDGSAAQRLLKADMDVAANANMKPLALRAKRNEYKCFNKKTFLKHVHQEKSSRKASPYWSKKREDKNKKNRKEISAKKNDECDAFLQSLQEE